MPEFLKPILDILHDLPGFLDQFVRENGVWVYVLLFAIIFAETGLVIMPFLPGDSLLFAAGAVAARGAMDPWVLCTVLIVAAVIGDAVNYHLGKWLGPRVFNRGGPAGGASVEDARGGSSGGGSDALGSGEAAVAAASSSDGVSADATAGTPPPASPSLGQIPRGAEEGSASAAASGVGAASSSSLVQRLLEKALNRKHLDRAHAFFEKYGGKAVVLARFVPIVRTFVPFVAGAGAMNYGKFAFYNVFGAFLWVGICVGGGWFFGNIPWVQKNFEAVIVAIIVVSLIPLAVEFILAKRREGATRSGENAAGGAA